MAGKFIVFEGIDGSGKSVMARKAKEFLINEKRINGNGIVLTQEPTNSSFGTKAKFMQATEFDPMKSAEECLGLYLKDRMHHLRFLIEPSLQMNKFVLCDRYKYSTFVYQSLQGIDKKRIIDLHSDLRIPDLILVFDIRAGIALERMNKDYGRKQLEKFEEKDFLSRASREFSELKLFFPKENIKLIDAEKSKEQVFEEVKKRINEIL
ncbi:MAG: dTMP kinase [Candidatus Diapherotrites archaeon]